MIAPVHWVCRPRLAELMAELGELSKVPESLKSLEDGSYRKRGAGTRRLGTAQLYGEEALQRLREQYGTAEK